MDNRKKIALLVAQVEESGQTLFIKGFLDHAFKYGYDVCVFSMFQKYQNSPAREAGDSSIFDLIEYSSFDAFVLLIDTIQTPGAEDRIVSRLRESFDGPVIVCDKKIDGFRSAYEDNISPVKKLISHLIEEHGYTDIAFLTGKSWHPHSVLRLNAYKEAMEEHGLQVNSDRIFYGDFWYFSGENVAERLCKSTRGLPQALACANDCMAIGAAKYFTSKGYKIPDDIAIVGYDTNDEGQHAPVPLTSAPLPSREFGMYCADLVRSELEGTEMPDFVADVDLFIGSSCGCHNESIKPEYTLRLSWDTEMSQGRVNNAYNHMNEDMLLQISFNGLVNTIFSNTYQIRPFQSLNICLNDDWTIERSTFTPKMLHLIQCGSEGSNSDSLNFLRYYDRKEMLPEINDFYYQPRVYYFFPMHFEELCFGFVSLCYTDPDKVPGQEERTWIRNIILGLEQYRRRDSFVHKNSIIDERLKRDPVTGMYNYSGFINEALSIVAKTSNFGKNIGILTVDIKDLSGINNKLGHVSGDNTINALANMVKKVFNGPGAFCFCMGNGEIVALKLTNENAENVIKSQYDKIINQIYVYNENVSEDGRMALYSAIGSCTPNSPAELELAVNDVINKKNEKKAMKSDSSLSKLSPEEKAEAQIVGEILDNNLLAYHFQPIVNAKTGEIFSYEALMRADITPYLSPLKILKYAEYTDRLYDVERLTFKNVLRIMRDRKDIFDGSRKLFINSIPGQKFHGKDLQDFIDAVDGYSDTVVIEFTEQAELTDEEISILRAEYTALNLETALDDYGTGYSNVANLLRYKPNYLKIDRMLLSGIENSESKRFFVKSVIDYAHSNNIISLAEGVETSAELRTVIELGADLIQGFYTARPNGIIAVDIDPEIKKEILMINEELEEGADANVYVAGRESRIQLAQLYQNSINIIDIYDSESTFHDFEIIGVPSLNSKIGLHIHSGYSGKITLENAEFGQVIGYDAVIVIEEGCDVTLSVKGECTCYGSIYVSEDSRVVFEGDGRLYIYAEKKYYYGIGAGYESKCGGIFLDMAGEIHISGTGMMGVGIGCWEDCIINTSDGKYFFKLNGQNNVGIGSYRGHAQIDLTDVKVIIDSNTSNCVGVGSGSGQAKVDINHITMKQQLQGNRGVAIGTDLGSSSDVFITKSNIECTVNCRESVGIGVLEDNGDAKLRIDNASVTVNVSGDSCAYGTRSQKGSLSAQNARVVCSVENDSDSFIGTAGKDLDINNCDACFVHNGERLSMKELFAMMGRTGGPPPDRH